MSQKTAAHSLKSLWDHYPQHKDVPLLLAVSLSVLLAGLLLPLFKVTQLVVRREVYSILSGIGALMHEGEYFLGAILFLFSVIFPVVKLAREIP